MLYAKTGMLAAEIGSNSLKRSEMGATSWKHVVVAQNECWGLRMAVGGSKQTKNGWDSTLYDEIACQCLKQVPGIDMEIFVSEFEVGVVYERSPSNTSRNVREWMLVLENE